MTTMIEQFYAITVEPNQAHDAIVDAARIQVLSLDYKAGSSLSDEAQERLVSAIVPTLGGTVS